MTQKEQILKHLKRNKRKGITSLEAIELYGATRLSGIIWYLKHHDGYNIESEEICVPTRYGKTYVSRYTLVEQ